MIPLLKMLPVEQYYVCMDLIEVSIINFKSMKIVLIRFVERDLN